MACGDRVDLSADPGAGDRLLKLGISPRADLPAYAGLAMQAELDALARVLEAPARPLAAIVGGAKVSTKLALLGNLLAKVDVLAIGGGMANTFLFAQGHPIGASMAEKDMADTARDILAAAEKAGCEILLPSDVVTAREFKAGADAETKPAADVADGDLILDAGPDAVARLAAAMDASKTLIWNGPPERCSRVSPVPAKAAVTQASSRSGASTKSAFGQRPRMSAMAASAPVSAAKARPQSPRSVPMASAGPKAVSNQPQAISNPSPARAYSPGLIASQRRNRSCRRPEPDSPLA